MQKVVKAGKAEVVAEKVAEFVCENHITQVVFGRSKLRRGGRDISYLFRNSCRPA